MSWTRAISTTSRRELSSSFFFLQSKAPKEIYAIVTETLACFLPGRAKDLSAPMYTTSHTQKSAISTVCYYSSVVNQLEHIILRPRVSKYGHCYTGAATVIATALRFLMLAATEGKDNERRSACVDWQQQACNWDIRGCRELGQSTVLSCYSCERVDSCEWILKRFRMKVIKPSRDFVHLMNTAKIGKTSETRDRKGTDNMSEKSVKIIIRAYNVTSILCGC